MHRGCAKDFFFVIRALWHCRTSIIKCLLAISSYRHPFSISPVVFFGADSYKHPFFVSSIIVFGAGFCSYHPFTPSSMCRTGPSRIGLYNAGKGRSLASSSIGSRGFATHKPDILRPELRKNSASRSSKRDFDVLNGLVEGNAAWKIDNDSQRNAPEAKKKNKDDLIASMTRLTIRPSPKAKDDLLASIARLTKSPSPKAVPKTPEWRRKGPKPEEHRYKAVGSRNGLLRIPDRSGRTLVSAASKISHTLERSWDQPRMTEAGCLSYYPFHKHEFVPGTIIRAVVHEQDFMDTPKPMPSKYPTTTTNPGNKHVTHGAFGPVYSENRFLIVVNNRPEDHYLAIPVYSHKGNGLAKKLHKDEYVSLADHRHLANCQQQSAHAPLVTEFLKDGVEELMPMSVAYTSYPVSFKFGLPVAHQGRLNEESTKRLVAMYLQWARPEEL